MGACWAKHGVTGGSGSRAATPLATALTATGPSLSSGTVGMATLGHKSFLHWHRSVPPRQGIMKRHGAPAQRTAKPFWRQGFCAYRKRPRVAFRNTIVVTEFARLLDGGGTVPGDGTKVTLGLGHPVRRTFAPLAIQHSPKRRIEESAWVPTQKRVRLLRKSMGDAHYFGAWARRRWEVARIRRLRHESTLDPKDQTLMPSTFKEAHERALELQASIDAIVAAPLPPKPPAALWPKSAKPKASKRKLKKLSIPNKMELHKKARMIGQRPMPSCGNVVFTGTGVGAGTKCHLCMRVIAEGELDQRCMCLVESAEMVKFHVAAMQMAQMLPPSA